MSKRAKTQPDTSPPTKAPVPRKKVRPQGKPQWLHDAEKVERKRLIKNIAYAISIGVSQYRKTILELSTELNNLAKGAQNVKNFDDGLDVNVDRRELDHAAALADHAAALAVGVRRLRGFIAAAERDQFGPAELRSFIDNWLRYLVTMSTDRSTRPEELAGLAHATRVLSEHAEMFLALEHRRLP